MKAIVALDLNNGLALNGRMPWQIPSDLAFFYHQTKHSPVIMGRKTYTSVGGGLKQRHNLVLTRGKWVSVDKSKDIQFFSNVEDLKTEAVRLQTFSSGEKTIWVIGGAEIYSLFLPSIDEIVISRVQKDYSCDKFFPDMSDFTLLNEVDVVCQKGDSDYVRREWWIRR